MVLFRAQFLINLFKTVKLSISSLLSVKYLSFLLNYVKLKPFKVKKKFIKVNYKLDLLVKIKIHPVQYIAILEPVHREYKLPIYKADTYRGRKENKWEV